MHATRDKYIFSSCKSKSLMSHSSGAQNSCILMVSFSVLLLTIWTLLHLIFIEKEREKGRE